MPATDYTELYKMVSTSPGYGITIRVEGAPSAQPVSESTSHREPPNVGVSGAPHSLLRTRSRKPLP